MGAERRSGEERRRVQREISVLIFASRNIRRAFEDWALDHGSTDVLRLVSNRHRILACQWELWSVLLDYNLKEVDFARDVYLNPEQRDEVFEEVEKVGYARRIVHITRSDGRVVDMDIIYYKHGNGYYYTFVKIL